MLGVCGEGGSGGKKNMRAWGWAVCKGAGGAHGGRGQCANLLLHAPCRNAAPPPAAPHDAVHVCPAPHSLPRSGGEQVGPRDREAVGGWGGWVGWGFGLAAQRWKRAPLPCSPIRSIQVGPGGGGVRAACLLLVVPYLRRCKGGLARRGFTDGLRPRARADGSCPCLYLQALPHPGSCAAAGSGGPVRRRLAWPRWWVGVATHPPVPCNPPLSPLSLSPPLSLVAAGADAAGQVAGQGEAAGR